MYNFKKSSQSSLRQEMSLELLEFERRNLLQHFKIEKDNYAATFKSYAEKVGLLLTEQEYQIEELSREKSRLEAGLLREDSSAQQDKQ